MENTFFNNNSLSRLIAEQITKEIITGKLKAGDKLIEATYAEEFGTSRAPIREAFYLLAIDGLVERIPRKGSVVKGYSQQDQIDLLDIRLFLELLAMDRIAESGLSDSVLHKMENLLSQMRTVMGNPIEYTKLNQKFHMAIIEMSKSEIIYLMYSRLGLPLTSLQRISLEGESIMKKSLKEHEEILHCLQNRKFDEAKRVLIINNKNVIKPILDKMSTLNN
ncbi:GntR family transcriptional regulator [Bacillus sp. FJAT-27251]|uniref:GntR family transcriptional regulator n=1 Tax=Bacillus sp. FJAT-27251 TaxID=1684142 RepID=UPI0006A7D68D|nr:GntR family transcriptional regulator [Bacillus sp. FJAT-27251]